MADREGNNLQKNQVRHNKRQYIQSSQHIFRRRQPKKFEQGENVLYVSTKTNTKVTLNNSTNSINFFNLVLWFTDLYFDFRHILNVATN